MLFDNSEINLNVVHEIVVHILLILLCNFWSFDHINLTFNN